MKKALSFFLIFALLLCLFAFPVNAIGEGSRYYRQLLNQYFDGADLYLSEGDYAEYEELYLHQTGGATDWALIRADIGEHAEAEIERIMLGRYFYQCDIAFPFTFTYGIYDAARGRFYDLCEIEDESRYPDLQEVLDRFHVGKRIGYEPLFFEEFCRFASWEGAPYPDVILDSYGELAYHYSLDGALDWVLVTGMTNMEHPTICYEVIGDRVFRSNGYSVPFDLTYGIFNVHSRKFIDLTQAWQMTRYAAVTEDLETLGLGEKIGDLNADGRLDIDDATEMQRCLAEFCDYPADDGVEADGWQRLGGKPLAYRSDVNGDGMRSISDVTATQRILAGITE